MQALKRLWEAWKHIAHKIGNFQARLILTIFYAVLMFPFGMAARLFSDPLRIRRRSQQWIDCPDEACDMQWARRQ